uniref:Amino acid transporter transmembrane domain-containing protein n=1 Tax=Trieres chinensis TaxID=1514140 RepID=A0A7S2EFA4_TRICV|mmetsp:Transcript_21501/g.43441  ORF Transcript_21501/g.43441 Transcript_21501/m.43441 type:complete len:663 (+) Transcript_21501:144-2132(+)
MAEAVNGASASAHSNNSNGIEVSYSSAPGETSSLLNPSGSAAVGGTGSSPESRDYEDATPTTTASGGSGGGDELEKPWPATFGRTITLLAGPHPGDVDLVDKVTKSPKLTPLLIARKGKRFKNAKGSLTPELGGRFPTAPAMAKYHSLDFPAKGAASEAEGIVHDNMLERERKALEAKAYRLNVLGAKGSHRPSKPMKDEEMALHSPGYHREKQTDYVRKQTMEEEQMKAESGRDATFSQCCFNMANILMGVGMLGLPFVFKSAGWIGGFFVSLSFGAVTWRTSVLIGRELNGDPRPCHTFDDNPYKSPTVPGSSPTARMRRPINTFPDIAREAFGENGCVILSSVLYFELFSCLCIFFVTLGDHLHILFPQMSETKHMIIVAIVLTIPTALLRTPRLLSYLSAVGTFATVSVVLAVVCSALLEGDMTEKLASISEKAVVMNEQKQYHILWRTSGLPIAFGLIAYTFSGHAIVPSIYSSMARPQDFERMIDTTFLVVLSCCLLVAISGYAMFGSFVEDQITISLMNTAGSSAELAMTMLTWLMILTAFSKFTLTMFPLAIGMEEIVAPLVPSEKVMETVSSIIKLVLIVLSLCVAIFIPSFSFLCSLVGLICTMIVSAIFPAAAHLKLFGPKLPLWEKILDWFFIIAGSVMAIVGTISTVGI